MSSRHVSHDPPIDDDPLPAANTSSLAHVQSLVSHLDRVDRLRADREFDQAQELAWAILAEIGVESYEHLLQFTPDNLHAAMPHEYHPVAARALTHLGIHYRSQPNGLKEFHLHVVSLLERALILSPDNIEAALNLSDACVSVSSDRIATSNACGEHSFAGNIHSELMRESKLGISLLERMLTNHFRIDTHSKKREVPLFPNPAMEGQAVWALTNLGKIHLNYANEAKRDEGWAGAEPHFERARECAEWALVLHHLPTEVEQLSEVIKARLSKNGLGRYARQIGDACSLIASSCEALKDPYQASEFYRLAAMASPGNNFAANRFATLSARLAQRPDAPRPPAEPLTRSLAPERRQQAPKPVAKKTGWSGFQEQFSREPDGRLQLAIQRAAAKLPLPKLVTPVFEQFVRDVGTINAAGTKAAIAFIDDVLKNISTWWKRAYSDEGFVALVAHAVLIENYGDVSSQAEEVSKQLSDIIDLAGSSTSYEGEVKSLKEALQHLYQLK